MRLTGIDKAVYRVMSDYFEVMMDRYVSEYLLLGADNFYDWLYDDIDDVILHMIDRGLFENSGYFDPESWSFPFEEVNFDDITTYVFNQVVDELNIEGEPYRAKRLGL